jgi:RNA-directed DNA polymerase
MPASTLWEPLDNRNQALGQSQSDECWDRIFEAGFPSEIYAYRTGRNAQQAFVEVEEVLFGGHPDVVDADLLKSVARRIVDRRVLHLIKMWLEGPLEETDQRGRTTRTTEARDSRRGIPQGSPLSPLTTAGEPLHAPVCAGWKKLGLEQSLGTRLVTYADDLVILCRRGSAENALHHLREIMGQAEADSERGEDTDLQGSGRGV